MTACPVTASPTLTPVAELRERELVSVRARIVCLTYPSRHSTPVMRAQVKDHTGVLDVIWQGRTVLAGLRVGMEAVFTTRICRQGGRLVMFNPAYRIIAPPVDER